MTKRVGRNEPCPCGSGKKYKKCCLDRDHERHVEETNREFRENLTGTPLDEYFEFMRFIQIYSNILKFEPDGEEFFRAEKEFVKEFKPGKKGWIPDSYLENWLLLDFRFGLSGKTVCERVIEKEAKNLVHPGPENLGIIAGSYFAFYAVDRIGSEDIILEDLFTLKKWKMQRMGMDYFELEAEPGQVWYTRLIGVQERCYNVSVPYVFDPEDRTDLSNGVQSQVKTFMRDRGINGQAGDRVYVESCKDALRTWVRYMLTTLGKIKQAPREALGLNRGAGFTSNKDRKKTTQPCPGICYSFDIELAHIKPKIWRRVRVPADMTLEEFAYVIIEMFGWHGGHLHGFSIGGKEYGMMDMDETGEMEEEGMLDERKTRLSELEKNALGKCMFVYDFGDNWEHIIKWKESGPADGGCMHPLCYDGARAAPPEDCGSVPGYYEAVEALKKKNNPTEEQKERLEWLGEYYDPEFFDMKAINQAIKNPQKLAKLYRAAFE